MVARVTFSKPIQIKLEDQNNDRVRRSTQTALTELQQVEVVNGRLVEDVVLFDATPKRVQHGLGHEMRGWLIADIQISANGGAITPGRIQRVSVSNQQPGEFWLQADGYGALPTVTLALWVF